MTLYETVKMIVKEKKCLYINECNDGSYTISKEKKEDYILIDIYSASIINLIFDSLGEKNKINFLNKPFSRWNEAEIDLLDYILEKYKHEEQNSDEIIKLFAEFY